MSIQQENEIRALRLQVAGLNEQVGIFLRQIREKDAAIASKNELISMLVAEHGESVRIKPARRTKHVG